MMKVTQEDLSVILSYVEYVVYGKRAQLKVQELTDYQIEELKERIKEELEWEIEDLPDYVEQEACKIIKKKIARIWRAGRLYTALLEEEKRRQKERGVKA